MRKYYWYFTGYLQKHGSILLASVVLAVVLFSLLIPRFINSIEQKERVYIGIVGSYSLNALPEQISTLISSGLTSVDPDGTIRPSVAERWIVEDNGKTYRFVIKKNPIWQDEKLLSTSDLQYNFKNVEVITTPNELVFKLPEPYVPFPSLVSQPLLRFETQRYNFFTTRQMPIGLGNFKVTNYKEENGRLKEIEIDSVDQRRIFRFYLTEEQAVIAFKHGQVDRLTDFSSTYDIFNWKNVSVAKNTRQDRYIGIFFDTANPKFGENIRQALSYALPKPTDDNRAIGPISPLSWVYLESGKRYDYDQNRALERLFSQLPPVPMHFELVTTANFQNRADEIKKAWETFGKEALERCVIAKTVPDKTFCPNVEIKVTIRVSNFPDTSNFEAMLVGQQIPPDPDQYFAWHSEQPTNFTHYKNTRIDALLEKGRTTANADDRKAIYQEFQQFFLEDSPAIFLEFLPSYEVSRT